jgi:hypothetical protein
MQHDVANYMVGKGIAYFRKWASAPTQWMANTTYAPGAYVLNGDTLWTTDAGGESSTGAGPTGATDTFTDGGLVWTAVPWQDLGNCPKFSFKPEIETLEHFSSREGVKTRDQKIVTALKGALTVELDEITPENLQFALLGSMTGAAGARVVKVFANAQVTGEVKLVQTNSIGRRFELNFGHVQVMPDQEIDFIGDDYSTIQTTLEVNLDAQGVFWTATELP